MNCKAQISLYVHRGMDLKLMHYFNKKNERILQTATPAPLLWVNTVISIRDESGKFGSELKNFDYFLYI